ncbi:HigA family addiction module antitoxin [Methylobacterium platani]|uniref:Transcriptional regulator n=1 Tax=Methylobacterium platani TaxID=427683 RepID=A0A179S4R7_9HYPH|nr:HigA family addiction module antitoxin [Methylobacterium platani]OAS19963.1 transcriptional regulator [Methylobacterium platani]
MSTAYETETVLPPMHPGEVLREEFMVPLNLTAYAIAKACRVPRTRIERIAREEIGITADTALRLGRYFGMDPQVWVNLQSRFDLLTARNAIGAEMDEIRPLERAAA